MVRQAVTLRPMVVHGGADIHLQLMEYIFLWMRPHAGSREEYEEEGAAESMHYELTTIPIPYAPALLTGRR